MDETTERDPSENTVQLDVEGIRKRMKALQSYKAAADAAAAVTLAMANLGQAAQDLAESLGPTNERRFWPILQKQRKTAQWKRERRGPFKSRR